MIINKHKDNLGYILSKVMTIEDHIKNRNYGIAERLADELSKKVIAMYAETPDQPIQQMPNSSGQQG